LSRPLYAFVQYEETNLIAVGNDGKFYNFDTSTATNKTPLMSTI